MVIRFPTAHKIYTYLILSQYLWISSNMASSKIFSSESVGKAYSTALTDLSLDLYKKLIKPDENLFFSPFSVSTALSMVHIGARGNTLEQMSNVLHVKQLGEQVYDAMEAYLRHIMKDNSNFTLNTANRIYPSTKFKPEESFLEKCSKHFHSSTVPVDFLQAEKVRTEINDWVSKQTNEKIKDLLPQGSITSNTFMILINAIYFKGNWASQFKPDRTQKMEFHTGSESVLVDMMYQRQEVKHMYNSDLLCNMVKLMYQGGSLSMLLILPDTVDGLPELETKIDSGLLQGISSKMASTKVDIWLPKFKLESEFKLSSYLKSLGMSDAFDGSRADFSGMDAQKLVYIDEVFHKAFVEVNEEGTEAAAATAVKMVKRSIQIFPQFRADHPFLFYIVDEKTDVILFAGRLVKPESTAGRDEL